MLCYNVHGNGVGAGYGGTRERRKETRQESITSGSSRTLDISDNEEEMKKKYRLPVRAGLGSSILEEDPGANRGKKRR